MNEKCQVFTPENYVERLLNCIEYEENLYGLRILENSCGEGNILYVIVKRYIKSCKKMGLEPEAIRHGLERDIYAVEIDQKHICTAVNRINKLLVEEEIEPVDWNIYCEDYLRLEFQESFDFIVGNPPYITYSDLEVNDRMYVKEKFNTCKTGKFDYCYAFIEKSLSEISNEGKMSYLIPSSIFKTVFGFELRKVIINPLIKIIDFKTHKIFDEALVSSSIFICDMSRKEKMIKYDDESKGTSIKINKSMLEDKRKWVFSNIQNKGEFRFGDFFQVKHSVATLYNKAYVINEWEIINGDILVNNYILESDIIRNGYAPKDISKKKKKIIYPYYYKNGELKRYSDQEFKSKFPQVTKYLDQFEEKLDKRKSDKNSKWFEYGRSQALNHLDQEKLLTSTVISEEVLLMKMNKNDIPYSGLFIYPISDKSLDYAIDILSSSQFYKYAREVGIHINGNSVRITSNDILEYCFEEV